MANKIVYLTIDDAPSKDFKEKVNFLVSKKIPAIFFCIGKFIEKREKEIIYAIKKGFIIGNHSYNHPYFSDLSLKKCYEEIKKADKIIEEIYKKAGIKRPAKLFRFPHLDKGGHKNSKAYEKDWLNYTNLKKKNKIQGYLRKLGYFQPKFRGIKLKWFNKAKLLKDVDVFPTFDQFEYCLGDKNAPFGLSTKKAILARIDEDFSEEGRSLNYKKTSDIIMIHDHEYTTKLFYKIIKRYIGKGLVFKMPSFR